MAQDKFIVGLKNNVDVEFSAEGHKLNISVKLENGDLIDFQVLDSQQKIKLIKYLTATL